MAGGPLTLPRSRRKRWRYAVIAVVLAGLAAGTWAVVGSSGPARPAASNGPTTTVTRGSLVVSVTESGEVQAEKRKVISNEIRYSVIIKELVDEGDRVNKGDTIITFECRELLDAIENKRLAVTNARNSHSQAVENVQLEEKEVANLVRKAEQALEDAEADLLRYIEAEGPMTLFDANAAISTARRDLALAEDKLNFKLKVNADKELNSPFSENEIEAEKLSVEKLGLSLKKALSSYNKLVKYDHPREIRTLKMGVEDAKLALERARHTARSTMLTAESDRETKRISLELQSNQLNDLEDDANKLIVKAEEEGLVVYDTGGNRWRPSETVVEVGAKISPRQQLMIIPDLSTLLIRTRVYEAIIDQVNVGLKAHVRLDSRPDTVLTAHVAKVGVLPDSQHRWLNPGVKVFKVDIELDEDVPDLKPGMTAQVEIELLRLKNVLSVPVAAVFTEQETTSAYRLVAGRPKRTVVKVGQMNDTRVEILSGLKEGDVVLLTPPPSATRSAEKKKPEEGKDAVPGPSTRPAGAERRKPPPDGERRKPPPGGQRRKPPPGGQRGRGRSGRQPGGAGRRGTGS